ncbi:(Fe-S)-binding protein [Anaerosolibacter sp.]|uniref:(Fe-S)-binding protein n=1 Tax=Anaerosolibacter sp. TaxID=1872527 RepID=UPI0039F100B0
MKTVFAPGCALFIYKPELGRRVLDFLNGYLGDINEHMTCCRHEPNLEKETEIINTCAGCDRRYRQLYEGISTISLWEVLADSESFPFPDYHGKEMAILDACPTRDQERVHHAIRTLLKRMNITVVEPQNTRTKSTCCGDSFYGILPVEEVKEQMKKRAAEMPAEDVVVYCVSCCKSMHIGGKRPRYLVDLLFGEETEIGTFEPDEWHKELEDFINEH